MGKTNTTISQKETVNISGTTYDDVFRTLLKDCTQLAIPLINEMFHTDYGLDEKIELLDGTYYLTDNNGDQKKLITDSHLFIGGRKYHLECQSTVDGTMMVRMFEYDAQIAIRDSDIEKDCLTVRFPKSGVMYLRHNGKTPDRMKIRIEVPGDSCCYELPVMKIQEYTPEDIFARNLLFLIPFHIFVYEKDFKAMEENPEQLERLREEYQEICSRLGGYAESGKISEYTKLALFSLSHKVLDFIAANYEQVRGRIGDIMGGKILEYEAKTIYREGRQEGRQEGLQEGRRTERLANEKKTFQRNLCLWRKLIHTGYSPKEAADFLDLSREEFEQMMQA